MTNKMYSFRLLIAAVLLSGPGQAQEEFPIGAWFSGLFAGDNAHFAARLDTVTADGFNTIHAALVDTALQWSNFNQEWMALAQARDLKVQLFSWRQPDGWRAASAVYWARTFEAEDRNLFSFATGRQISDGDREVLQARAGIDGAGLLLDTDGRAGPFRLRENSTARYGHYAFWLRTDNNTGTQHLATLRFLRQSDGVVLDSLVVRRRHFSAVDTYEDFVIDCPVPAGSGGFRVRFQIHWTGAGNLWVDKVRAHDWDPGSRPNRRRSVRLFGGEYDSAIRDTLASYSSGTADPPWRFYLYDEPRWELNEAVAYMDALIRAQTGGAGGVTAVNLRPDTPGDLPSHRELLRNHLSTVNPSELLVDYYTFGLNTTGVNQVRRRLNALTTLYGPPREVTLERGIPLWVVVQAHSWPRAQRDPTPEEIRAQVNLALTHGAKGVTTSCIPA